jgi:tetratricopeptide (TPR) repeat protein
MANHRLPFSIRVKRVVAGVGQWLAECGAALVRPIERLFGWIARRFLSAMEQVQGIESVLLSCLRALTWPFRAVGGLIASLFANLLPATVRRSLTAPFRWVLALLRRLGRGLAWLAEKLNLDVVFVWLVWLLTPIWYPVGAVLSFVVVWAATRRYKPLLWGLPALLLLLPILVTAAWGAIWGHEYVADEYRLALKDALSKKDYSLAQMYERRLANLGVDTNMTDFHTAEALERDGKTAEAYERMQRLAPVERPGYPAAHFWIIQRLLSNKLDVPPQEAQRLINIHLAHLSTLSIRGPEIDLVHGLALVQQNQLEEASKLLKPLVAKVPLAAIQRMRIDVTLRDQDGAAQDALAVRDHMQSRIKKGMAIQAEDYQAWTIAEELLGNNARTRAVLTDWLKIDPNNQTARQDLGAVNLREFVDLVHGPSPDPDDLAAHIRMAFELSLKLDMLKKEVAAIYEQRAQIPELRIAFDKLAKSEDTPASLSETMGTAAALEHDWKSAENCLRRAVSKDPKDAVAWNNLACVLYQGANPRLDQALVAVNKAIELSPDEFRFRESRGQINVQLGKWSEAVTDLEFALNGMPDAPAIHKSLAKAYDALGNQELAAAHRNYAN